MLPWIAPLNHQGEGELGMLPLIAPLNHQGEGELGMLPWIALLNHQGEGELGMLPWILLNIFLCYQVVDDKSHLLLITCFLLFRY